MTTKEKKQKRYLDRMLGKMNRQHQNFDADVQQQISDKHMEDIKTKYSPNGGKKAFDNSSPFRKSPFRNRKGGWMTKDE